MADWNNISSTVNSITNEWQKWKAKCANSNKANKVRMTEILKK